MPETLTKSDIISDESLFQRACDVWVHRYIGECVSSLMCDVSQNLEQCSKIFDFDYEEAMGWFQRPDWESVVDDFILHDADYDQLEDIAGRVGWLVDICEKVGVSPDAWEAEKDSLETRITELDNEMEGVENPDALAVIEDWRDGIQTYLDKIDSFEDWVKGLSKDEDLRHAIIAEISSEYEEIGQEYDLEPTYDEVYEHWTIPEGFIANELKNHGQVIFDFGGLTIWGRMATGQSISMDGVIRRIVKGLDEVHWVWREVR